MKKAKKLLQGLLKRDKYATFRGAVFIVLVFSVSIYLSVVLMDKRQGYTAEEEANDAAMQIAQQLHQTVDSDIVQLSGSAYVLGGLTAEEAQNNQLVLQSLTQSERFSQTQIVHTPADSENAVSYTYNGQSAQVAVSENGALDIRLQIDSGSWLSGVTQANLIEYMLSYNDYKGAQVTLYDRVSGEILYNPALFTGDSYGEAIAALAQENRRVWELAAADQAQALVKMADGQSYYIAQTTIGVGDWSLLMTIPEAMLADAEQAQRNRSLLPIYLLMGILLISASVGMLIYSYRYLRRIDRLRKDETATLGEMLTISTQRGGVCLLTSDHNADTLVVYGDTEAAAKALFQDRSFKTLDEMLEALLLDEEEATRVRKACADLRPGQKIEVQLHRLCGQREQQLLMSIAIASGHRPQTVFAICDNTEEIETKRLAAEEKKYRAAMQAKCTSIWQINFDRDCWKATYGLRDTMISEIGIHKSGWRCYSADLTGAVRDYVEEEDYDGYVGTMLPTDLYERYQRGEREMVCEYRSKAGQEGSEWHRAVLHLFCDPVNGELLANMYVTNIDAEKNAENERLQQSRTLASTLMAISGVFYALFYANLDEDRCYTAKIPNNELVTQLSEPYKQMFDRYINDVVHPEDREQMRRVVSAYNLRKDMHEGCHYVYSEFRRRRGDSYEWAAIIVQAARFENGTVRDVALAFRRLDRDYEAEGQNNAPERALA